MPTKVMTQQQFTERATLENAFKAQAAATPPDIDSLRGCLMMAVQMAHQLNLPKADLTALLSDETDLWQEYLEIKLRVLANRKAKK